MRPWRSSVLIAVASFAGGLVKALREWEAKKGADLPELMLALAGLLREGGFWGERDVELMAAWVADLKAVGYRYKEETFQRSCQPPRGCFCESSEA